MASSSSTLVCYRSTLLSIITILIISTSLNSCHASNRTKISAILIFGDSTVDTGNNNFIATLFKGSHYPYGLDFPGQVATGRFSNGKLVPDFLASAFGIKQLVPPYLDPNLSDDDIRTGVSFASAGSGLDDLTTVLSGVLPVSKQPGLFREYKERLEGLVGEEEANRILGSAVVVFSAGSNDLLFNFYDIPTRQYQYNISEYQDFLLQNLQTAVKELYDLGCRIFVLSGLPPIGCVPIQMTAKLELSQERKCLETEDSDARVYNSKLRKLVPEIQASLNGTKVLYANIYDPLVDMINHPQKYGFETTNRGCCGTGLAEMGPMCNAFTPICSNRSQYIFWDAIHPGEVAYRSVANTVVDNLLPLLRLERKRPQEDGLTDRETENMTIE